MSNYLAIPGGWPLEPATTPATSGLASFAGSSPSDYNNFGYPPTELPADLPPQYDGGRTIQETPANNTDVGVSNTTPKRPLIIAVFGKTGTGKTSFIEAVTGQGLKIGHGQASCTDEVLPVSFKIGNQEVVLIDTPGFSDSQLSDTQVLALIAEWMKDSYDAGALLSGILYLHRISDIRFDGPSVLNMRMMERLCGANSLKNVVVASTMWEQVTLAKGIEREEELKSTFWKDLIAGGATVSRIEKDTKVDAMAVVRMMLNNTPIATRLQQELSAGKVLGETDAGTEIRQGIEKIETKLKDYLRLTREELKIANSDQNRRAQQSLNAYVEQLNENFRRINLDRDYLRKPVRSLPRVNREGLFGLGGYHCKVRSCRKHTNKSGKWTCSSCGHKQINNW